VRLAEAGNGKRLAHLGGFRLRRKRPMSRPHGLAAAKWFGTSIATANAQR
jgi:hypothetical protein